MSTKYDRLKSLLLELFQLDKPDLDFGIYRIMHARAAEISGFLDSDLLPQVRQALAVYDQGNRTQLEADLAEATAQAIALGAVPETLPKIVELRAQLADASKADAIEGDVYDLIYRFFSRYYSEGDFISQRRYTSESSYAIPYNGEEVTLHWANKDQYYIKTSEYLRDYAFRLNVHDDANPMRVRFKLVDATEGEHGNVKATEGTARVFVLADAGASGHDFVEVEAGELTICFEYRPATNADWPVDQRAGQAKPPKQKDLAAFAETAVLACSDPELAPWVRALAAPRSGSPKSMLASHVERYVARNTFDYFIHKDLGTFLRRELDFFIKNELMRLDDIEDETAAKVEQYLSKIKAVRKVAGKIIDFLAQLEDFQKKLWLKKKFVVGTSYLITVGNIDERFYDEICANDAQREEWVQLFAVDKIEGDLATAAYSTPLTPSFLKSQPTLTLNTELFGELFVARVIESQSDSGSLDMNVDGLLIHSENFQAISAIQARYRASIDCIYIDPPYNTDASAIVYKNDYKDSSWLSLIENRLRAAQVLLTDSSVVCIAIDDAEQSRLQLMIDGLFGTDGTLGVVPVRSNPAGRSTPKGVSAAHEYAFFVAASDASQVGRLDRTDAQQARYSEQDGRSKFEWVNFRKHGGVEARRQARPRMFYPVYTSSGSVRLPRMDWDETARSWTIDEQPTEAEVVVWPLSPKGDELRWKWGVESFLASSDNFCSRPDQSGEVGVYMKSRVNDAGMLPVSWWDDKRYSATEYGTNLLKNILGSNAQFSFPKALGLVVDCLRASGVREDSFVLDFFAGSGTTGHAVIELNRADAGRRAFCVIEAGSHFGSALVPRLRRITYAPVWSDGAPKRLASSIEAERSPRLMKVLQLESYEDTLNNLDLRRDEHQQSLLDSPAVVALREGYNLRYMLDVESRGSQSLLNVAAFTDPTVYQLNVKSPGSDESRLVNADLLETFNYLIGLTVIQITAPRSFAVTFERDDEKRLQIAGFRQAADGPYWFRTVTGTSPDGQRVLVIWRKRPGGEDPEGVEQDNAALDHWFTNKQQYSVRDSEFDVIYVNGDNNLENMKRPDETWKVRLIEEDFHRLMFDTDGMP